MQSTRPMDLRVVLAMTAGPVAFVACGASTIATSGPTPDSGVGTAPSGGGGGLVAAQVADAAGEGAFRAEDGGVETGAPPTTDSGCGSTSDVQIVNAWSNVGAGDVHTGVDGAAPFALLVTQTTLQPGDQSTWGGVAQYLVAGDGAPLQPAPGIPASELADPISLAFREASSEVFVGNRQGNADGGVRPLISRFLYDRVAHTFTPNGAIAGDGLGRGAAQIAFDPATGDLLVCTGRLVRFAFDSSGNAVLGATTAEGACAGVAVAPDGKRVFVTGFRWGEVSEFDLACGLEVRDVLSQGNSDGYPHGPPFLTLRGNQELYATGLTSQTDIFALDGADDLMDLGSTDQGMTPFGVAFSPDAQERFTLGYFAFSDQIMRCSRGTGDWSAGCSRFPPASTCVSSPTTSSFTNCTSLGTALVIPLP